MSFDFASAEVKCQPHSVAGPRKPARRESTVPLSSLTTGKLRHIAEQIKDPVGREKALEYVKDRERRERDKRNGQRRREKAARRNNRRS